jgi:hypothetical protein
MCARSFISVLRLTPIAMRGSRTVGSRGRFFGGPARSAVRQIQVMLVMRLSGLRRPLYLLITVYEIIQGHISLETLIGYPDLLV